MTPRILVLCTANSARSQMAEGLFREALGRRFEIHSAGARPSFVRPEAIAVMAELGIDLSTHRSKSLDEFLATEFRYVVTVCDHARDACPHFPGLAERIHWSLPDPAAVQGPEEDRLAAFRQVRDQLRALIQNFAESNASHSSCTGRA
jgi:arsenate reductase